MQASYDYAVIRVVPRVERGEFINAGVVLFCAEQRFLGVRTHLDAARLHALWPHLDKNLVDSHLRAFRNICAGIAEAGPIAALSERERFHWLVAPRSTLLQLSPVHSGLCTDAAETLEQLFRQLV